MSPPRQERTETPLTQGIAVVRLLLQRGYALGVTQIAADLGMPKSSLHRLLKTLCQIGFLQQNPRNHRYGVDAGIFAFVHEIAAHFARNMSLDTALRKAAATLDASVYIDMLGGRNAYVVCAAGDEGNTLRLGMNSPIHASSPGKILVAQMPESSWPAYAPREDDEAVTPCTNLSPERFYAQLRQAREAGFAWNIRETSVDHVSVAAVVREPLVNPPRLAVAILLRHDAYLHRDQHELEQSVLALADRLGRVLAVKR
ncbi:helix-turn-helix domain-containing protein [Termitidicoccus mucosus]|uniref:Transcriptional regulator n=1 Tax=Termitidicoccus mucosus TaxID=1184151 RepID=A0A178IIR8_9BACT|nr:transcriptional regulator [Opitutaceae bacterium TSB47]